MEEHSYVWRMMKTDRYGSAIELVFYANEDGE